MWAAGNAGYGSAAAQLATATSQADGTFNFGTDSGTIYSCPSSISATASQLIYITASGGQPTTGVTNPSAAFMVALGDCLTAKANNPTINIDEVTTVASMFAMAQFFQPSTGGLGSFGTSATNLSGLANAMTTVRKMVNVASGTAYASTTVSGPVNGYATAPVITIIPEQAKIDTLADILAACINSTGPSSIACSTLFSNVSPTPAQDTLQAAFYLASNPTSTVNGVSHIGSIYGLLPPQSPFLPTLPAAPTDWTVGVTYGTNSAQTVAATPIYFVSKPASLAIDSQGNVWFANAGANGLTGNSVSELSPAGVPLSQVLTGVGTLINPRSLVLDPANNLYVASYGAGGTGAQVSEVTAIGQTNTFTLRSTGPETLASDGAGNIYIATYGGADGAGDLEILPSHSASGTMAFPVATGVSVGDNSSLAIDSYNDLWLSNNSSTATTQFRCAGIPCATSTTTAGGQTNPRSVAIDHSNAIWIGNGSASGSGSMSLLAPTTGATITAAPGSPFTGGGLSNPTQSVFGGLGNLWITNYSANAGTITELSPAGAPVSPASGFVHTFAGATGIAVDSSGNVWVGNADAAAPNGFLTEIVGAAGPAITPYAANLPATAGGANTIGNRP